MTVTYCPHSDVSGFLQVPAFSGSTNPTSTQVEDRINEAEDYIDGETGHAWRTTTVSNEYHNVDLPYRIGTGIPVYLNHRTITTLSSGTDKIEVFDGSSWIDWVASSDYTEGRDNDYWMDYTSGVLYLRTSLFFRYPKEVRVTYRYGESTVAKDIKNACIKLVAIDLVGSDDRSVLLPEVGGSQVGYRDKIESWRNDVEKVLKRRKEVKAVMI